MTLDMPRVVVLRGEPAIAHGALALPLATGVCVAVQRPQLPALELVEEEPGATFAVEVRGRCEMRGVETAVLRLSQCSWSQ